MENALTVQIEQADLPATEKSTLLQTFSNFFRQSQEWNDKAKTIVITSEDQIEEMQQARTARLALKSLRVDTEHARKKLKEESLRKGQTIDAIAKIITNEIIPTEKYLEEQENFLAIREAQRKRELGDRRALELGAYVDTEYFNLREMTEEKYQELLLTSKNTAEAKKAEETRLENLRIEAEKKLQEERKAREKLEAEIAAKKAQEEKERQEKLQAEKDAALAPDREKLKAFATAIQALTTPDVQDSDMRTRLLTAKKALDKVARDLLLK